MGKIISPDNKIIAKTLATAFGVKPTVRAYWDEPELVTIDILQCPNPTMPEVIDYGTIGLSDYPFYKDGSEFGDRLELLSTAKALFRFMPNLLSTVAFTIIKDGWFCHPGSVLLDTISMYASNVEVKHLYFTSPTQWDNNLTTLTLETKSVVWLQIIPITEQERLYLLKYGDKSLETLLEERQTNIDDLNRKSAI